MSFLLPNEHLVFMEMQTRYEEPAVRLPADDIKKLVDAGITTCMSFSTFWDWIEPQKGVYDWSYYDDRIKLLNDCGMKVIFHAQTYFPNWMPDEWLVKGVSGNFVRMPSPWNPEAWEYCKAYYKMVRDRYNSDKVLVACSWLTDSETLFPVELCCYDAWALQAYGVINGENAIPIPYSPETNEFMRQAFVKVFTELQEIMAENLHREIWTSLHPALAGYYGNGCLNIDNILSQFTRNVPGVIINHLYCTWVQWAHLWPQMNAWGRAYGNVFGGAEYATGVIPNTELAKANGLRGLLIGCCHPHTNQPRVEDWMLDNIRQALRSWQ